MKRLLSLIVVATMLLTTVFSLSGCSDGKVGKSIDVGGHTYWYYD